MQYDIRPKEQNIKLQKKHYHFILTYGLDKSEFNPPESLSYYKVALGCLRSPFLSVFFCFRPCRICLRGFLENLLRRKLRKLILLNLAMERTIVIHAMELLLS